MHQCIIDYRCVSKEQKNIEVSEETQRRRQETPDTHLQMSLVCVVRNLLPYELYISGLNYQDALARCKPKSPHLQARRRVSTREPADDKVQDNGCDSQSSDCENSGDVSLLVIVVFDVSSVGLVGPV